MLKMGSRIKSTKMFRAESAAPKKIPAMKKADTKTTDKMLCDVFGVDYGDESALVPPD